MTDNVICFYCDRVITWAEAFLSNHGRTSCRECFEEMHVLGNPTRERKQ